MKQMKNWQNLWPKFFKWFKLQKLSAKNLHWTKNCNALRLVFVLWSLLTTFQKKVLVETERSLLFWKEKLFFLALTFCRYPSTWLQDGWKVIEANQSCWLSKSSAMNEWMNAFIYLFSKYYYNEIQLCDTLVSVLRFDECMLLLLHNYWFIFDLGYT